MNNATGTGTSLTLLGVQSTNVKAGIPDLV